MEEKQSELRRGLRRNPNRTILWSEVCTSTNLLAKTEGKEAEEGTLFLSDEQTAGRGRLGKSFFSPRGAGLYLSLCLRPMRPAAETLQITVMAAVAAARAVDRLAGIRTEIKWVNDLYVGGKKLCGILTEGEIDADGNMPRAVLGIGVNLAAPQEGFPPELREIATALDQLTKKTISKSRLAAEIVNEFELLYYGNHSDYMAEYQARSCLTGKTVTILSGGVPVQTGRVLGIDDDACLLLETERGERIALSAGEVSLKLSV